MTLCATGWEGVGSQYKTYSSVTLLVMLTYVTTFCQRYLQSLPITWQIAAWEKVYAVYPSPLAGETSTLANANSSCQSACYTCYTITYLISSSNSKISSDHLLSCALILHHSISRTESIFSDTTCTGQQTPSPRGLVSEAHVRRTHESPVTSPTRACRVALLPRRRSHSCSPCSPVAAQPRHLAHVHFVPAPSPHMTFSSSQPAPPAWTLCTFPHRCALPHPSSSQPQASAWMLALSARRRPAPSTHPHALCPPSPRVRLLRLPSPSTSLLLVAGAPHMDARQVAACSPRSRLAPPPMRSRPTQSGHGLDFHVSAS